MGAARLLDVMVVDPCGLTSREEAAAAIDMADRTGGERVALVFHRYGPRRVDPDGEGLAVAGSGLVPHPDREGESAGASPSSGEPKCATKVVVRWRGYAGMSVTPVPPERCGHVAPMVIDRTQGGYAARCLRCGGR